VDTHGLTPHARSRMQQRGIPPRVLECLLDYGREVYDGRGGAIVYFDKAARRRLALEAGRSALRALGKHLGAYAVLVDGGVKTVGHRIRRIRRR
jgi:hypothetical protein